MKRILAIVLAAVMLLTCFVGCAAKETSATKAAGSASASAGTASESAKEETSAQPEQSASASAATDNTVYKIEIGDVYAPEHIFAVALDQMAAELNEKSNGRLEVTTFHNSTLGSEKEELDAVAGGTLTMAIAGGGQIGTMYAPMLVFDAPYAIQSNDHLQAVMSSDVGAELVDGLSKQTGISIMGALYAGKRFITTKSVAVYKPDDLKGLKIRVPDQPLSIANFKAFGASPTPMAFSEVYLALQQGVVDGQENPLTQIMSAKFYEVQDYISTTGHVTQCVFLIANQAFLDSLPDDLRQLVTETTAEFCKSASETSVQFESDTLKSLETDYKMTVCDADVDAFKALAASVITEYASNWGEGLYERVQALAK